MEAASGGDGAGLPKPTAATCNAITGLATGRFGARLKNGVVTSQGIVHGKSDLSAADKAALARLPADGRYFNMNLEFPHGDYQLTAVRGHDGDVLITASRWRRWT